MSWHKISAFTIIRITVLESLSVMNFMVETSRQKYLKQSMEIMHTITKGKKNSSTVGCPFKQAWKWFARESAVNHLCVPSTHPFLPDEGHWNCNLCKPYILSREPHQSSSVCLHSHLFCSQTRHTQAKTCSRPSTQKVCLLHNKCSIKQHSCSFYRSRCFCLSNKAQFLSYS